MFPKWCAVGELGFSRREYWSGLPYPPPGDLPNPGIEPRSPVLQLDSLPAELPGKPPNIGYLVIFEFQMNVTSSYKHLPSIAWDILFLKTTIHYLFEVTPM